VLRQVARLLRESVRATDLASRYGGEEFTLVFPETHVEVAKRRCDQIREAIQELTIENQGETLRSVTVSMGAAAYSVHGETAEEVLRAADEALYQAKQSGRNRVVVASKPTQLDEPDETSTPDTASQETAQG